MTHKGLQFSLMRMGSKVFWHCFQEVTSFQLNCWLHAQEHNEGNTVTWNIVISFGTGKPETPVPLN